MKKLWRRQKTGRFIPRPHMSRRSRGASRGAISVFLSIVLVPCIAFTSLFVDLSRVRLAKNLVESAGDLALNSLLTHYDFDLNDYYGLVASCQNIEEFYESSAGYFARMLKSQGLSDEESKTLISSIRALAGGDDVADLLQTEIKTDLAEAITPVADADLANPTVVKDQLVEFMKYRAPINITSNFLKELGDNSSALEHAKDDQELAEKKRGYYEAENALMEKAYGIYVKLKAYQELSPSKEKLQDIADHLNSYREKFKKLHEAFVKDLFNTGSISEVRKTVYRLSDFYADDYDGETTAGLGQLRSLITNTARAITSYKNAKTQLENAFPEYNSGIYDIQYWAQNYNAVIIRQSALDTASSTLLTYYMRLENAFSYMSEDAAEGVYDASGGFSLNGTSYAGYDGADSEKSYYEHYYTLYSQVMGIYSSVLSSAGDEGSSDKYLKYIAIMQRISTARENKEAIDPALHQIDGKTVNRTVMDIYSEISSDRSSLKAFSDKLDGVAGTLNSMKDELREYKSAFDVWEDKAGTSVTEMGETDSREITDIKNGDTEAGRQLGPDEISEAGIDELKTRVTDMKALYDGLIAELDEMKYGGRKIKDITDAATAKSASGIRAASIKQTKSELDSYTDSSFSFTPAADPAVTVVLNATNAPDLTAPQNPMYGWMVSKFDGGKTDNKAAGDSKYKEYMSMGKDKANEEQTAEGVTENNIAASGDAFGLGEGLGSLVDLAVGLAKDFGGELKNRRDSLFAAEYAVNMFSYYSYENEGKYKLLEGKYDGNQITLSNHSAAYASVQGSASTPKTWLSIDPKDSYNKSLTTKMIYSFHNYALGAECEYLLYGKGTSKENVNAALTSMYVIRYLLNTPSGFAFFWNNPTDPTAASIEAVASAISVATGGIVPEPLIKAILILVLIAAESANDIAMLKAGLPVKFIKTSESDGRPDNEWAIAFSSSGMDGGTSVKESDGLRGFHLTYGNYLYIFLLLAFGNEDYSPQMYTRVGNVIQTNMNHIIHKNVPGGEYKLSNAKVYFDFKATVRVKPLMLALPISSGFSGNPKDKPDWCTFEYKTSRGYS